MKRLVTVLSVWTICFYAFAQEEMKEDLVTEFDHQFDYTYMVDSEYCFASSAKEITVFEVPSGKTRWNKKFSEVSNS